jgi:hypothetical protein
MNAKYPVGTQVRYRKFSQYGVNKNPYRFSHVAKITDSGLMRLEDGTLWKANGAGKGEFQNAYIEFWDDAAAAREAKRKLITKVRPFFSHLEDVSSEDLARILDILKPYGVKS